MNATNALAQFEGFIECALFADRGRICVTKEAIIASSALEDVVLPFELVRSISFADYAVVLESPLGKVTLSRLGREAEWLYDKALNAYNNAVAKALMAKGSCAFEAKGRCMVEEGAFRRTSPCTVRIYDDCLLLLTPDEGARRIPFCFLEGLDANDWSRTFVLTTGERYTVSHMGQNLENMERIVVQRTQAVRDETSAWHEELTPLQPMEAAAARKLMRIGTSAFAYELSQSAPRLLAAVEAKVSESRIASYYPWLKRIAAGFDYALGAKPADSPGEDAPVQTPAVLAADAFTQAGPRETESDASENAGAEGVSPDQQPVLWVIAPVNGGQAAAVELALADGEAAATYLYRVEGNWRSFAMQIDRALEAASFERSPILLDDEKLALHEHAAEAMLIARTPALQIMRRCFIGRAIHSSENRWLSDIERALTKA